MISENNKKMNLETKVDRYMKKFKKSNYEDKKIHNLKLLWTVMIPK